MAGIVVVFDFDKTIINCDSDNWLLDGFGASERFEELLLSVPWNTAMDMMMAELHTKGVSVDEMVDRLRQAPLDTHILSAIETAYALGCDLRIVSDANAFFIGTVLEHHGLAGYFSEVNTNPGFVDQEGRIRIRPYHDFHTSSHGCPDCPPNMCKSVILKRIQAEVAKENKQIIYLGDGKGDYCPVLNLTERDFVMPRRNYPMWELISSNPMRLRAEVHGWAYGEEQELVLIRLICQLLSAEAVVDSIAADCKSLTGTNESNKGLTKALPISN